LTIIVRELFNKNHCRIGDWCSIYCFSTSNPKYTNCDCWGKLSSSTTDYRYNFEILISEVCGGFKHFSFELSVIVYTEGIIWRLPRKIIFCRVVINSKTLSSIVSATGQYYCFDTISVDFSKRFPLTAYTECIMYIQEATGWASERFAHFFSATPSQANRTGRDEERKTFGRFSASIIGL